MGGHYADILRLVKKNQSSDTFAKHFASTIINELNPTPKILVVQTQAEVSQVFPPTIVRLRKTPKKQ